MARDSGKGSKTRNRRRRSIQRRRRKGTNGIRFASAKEHLLPVYKTRSARTSYISRNTFCVIVSGIVESPSSLLILLTATRAVGRRKRGGRERWKALCRGEREREKSWLRKPPSLSVGRTSQPDRLRRGGGSSLLLFSRACHVQEEAAAEHVSDVRRGTVHAYDNRPTRAKRG